MNLQIAHSYLVCNDNYVLDLLVTFVDIKNLTLTSGRANHIHIMLFAILDQFFDNVMLFHLPCVYFTFGGAPVRLNHFQSQLEAVYLCGIRAHQYSPRSPVQFLKLTHLIEMLNVRLPKILIFILEFTHGVEFITNFLSGLDTSQIFLILILVLLLLSGS